MVGSYLLQESCEPPAVHWETAPGLGSEGLEWEQGAASSAQQGKAVQHFVLRYRLNSCVPPNSLAHLCSGAHGHGIFQLSSSDILHCLPPHSSPGAHWGFSQTFLACGGSRVLGTSRTKATLERDLAHPEAGVRQVPAAIPLPNSPIARHRPAWLSTTLREEGKMQGKVESSLLLEPKSKE